MRRPWPLRTVDSAPTASAFEPIFRRAFSLPLPSGHPTARALQDVDASLM
jgi:hypothetical protein